MIVIQENDQSALEICKRQVEKLVLFICQQEEIYGDELYVNFVSKDRITELHDQHFNDPTPTDCITFPIDGNKIDDEDSTSPHVIGEVFICPEVAIDTCPHDPYGELSLYIAHTLLHLAEYNDIEDDDILKIREAENRILCSLKEKNLVLSNDNLLIS